MARIFLYWSNSDLHHRTSYTYEAYLVLGHYLLLRLFHQNYLCQMVVTMAMFLSYKYRNDVSEHKHLIIKISTKIDLICLKTSKIIFLIAILKKCRFHGNEDFQN